MSSRASRRAGKRLAQRIADYEARHARDPGFKRPGSLNPKRSVGTSNQGGKK